VSNSPPAHPPTQRSIVVRLEEPRGRLLRRTAGLGHAVTFTGSGTVVEHGRALRERLLLRPGTLALAAVDPGPAKAGPDTGRFPILRRLGPDAVVPKEEGIDGWVWTGRGGSALPALGDEDEAPNGLLLFAKPLAGEVVSRVFTPEWVRALADRSPLGDPSSRASCSGWRSLPRQRAPSARSAWRGPSRTARCRRRCGGRCPRTVRPIRRSARAPTSRARPRASRRPAGADGSAPGRRAPPSPPARRSRSLRWPPCPRTTPRTAASAPRAAARARSSPGRAASRAP